MAQGPTKTLLRRREGDVFVYEKPPASNMFLVRPDPFVARPSKKGYVTVRDLTHQGILGAVARRDRSRSHEYAVYVGPNRTRAVGHSDPSIIVD